jgi:2Fe-2S ferredoxin
LDDVRDKETNMPKLIVKTRNGNEKIIEAAAGTSVMEALRNGGMDEIQATCGGCCSCATCHVYVDPGWLAKLAPLSDLENDLLDCATHRRDNSRLSCQMPFDASLDGVRLTVAPED